MALLGLVAPLINTTRYSGKIKDALESSLGRKVSVGKAHFTLFSGPGFSLENVTISEDPRYGIEPFAYVPTLQARVRLDKLLFGQIRFASLRLVGPSLNIVRQADGTWNIVRLLERMGAPRHAPLNLFPSFEVSDGRVDFKLQNRKTTLYISESDLSIYPERSGKVYFQFSGSPARTDRAGNGFGHFRGNASWLLNSPGGTANQLDANLSLDPSDLSELTTLVEGHDVGVHGAVSSSLHMAGPMNDLKANGQLRLNDVHRWDLLPASGEDWTIHYTGDLDLLAHRLDLRTAPLRARETTPVTMRVLVNSFLARPSCAVVAELKNAPLESLLPLALRMGVPLPNDARIRGALDGAVGYSTDGGWAGGLEIKNAEAILSGAPPLRSAATSVTIAGDRIRFAPAEVLTTGGSSLRLAGDYDVARQQTIASFKAVDVPFHDLKSTLGSWFGTLPSLQAFRTGDVTGEFTYSQREGALTASGSPAPPLWAGRFEFANSTVDIPGLALPLQHAHGRASFNNAIFDLDRLTAVLGKESIRASYRYNLLAKHKERVRIEVPSAELSEIESAMRPVFEPQGIWARLRFTRRVTPAWLAARDVEGDLAVQQLSVDGMPVGSLHSDFSWQGTTVEFGTLALTLPQGKVDADGTVNLVSDEPRYSFLARTSGFHWKNGSLTADAEIHSHGTGAGAIRNLSADGSFEGERVTFSAQNTFDKVAGLFHLSFPDGWPDLRLSELRAEQQQDEWSGNGFTESDGKLLVDLAHDERKMHIVSSLIGEAPPEETPPQGQDPLQ